MSQLIFWNLRWTQIQSVSYCVIDFGVKKHNPQFIPKSVLHSNSKLISYQPFFSLKSLLGLYFLKMPDMIFITSE